MCNHDINAEQHTLQIIKKRVMIYPKQIDCFCPVCKKVFKFRKGDDNLWRHILNNNDQEEQNQK